MLVHAATACFMTGLIWFVQVVHYPLLGVVEAREFGAYHRDRSLVATNWIRTVGWTARSVVSLVMVAGSLRMP